jgi:hypothetical protein
MLLMTVVFSMTVVLLTITLEGRTGSANRDDDDGIAGCGRRGGRLKRGRLHATGPLRPRRLGLDRGRAGRESETNYRKDGHVRIRKGEKTAGRRDGRGRWHSPGARSSQSPAHVGDGPIHAC